MLCTQWLSWNVSLAHWKLFNGRLPRRRIDPRDIVPAQVARIWSVSQATTKDASIDGVMVCVSSSPLANKRQTRVC
ncbi:hypothetical protein IHE45_04G135400 [Dioscorea alata]|uniref:Uncharacterized protein n=1 Tax=Dioscorea alata TaxID=55571 RepID=A0ACB7WG07_DIOAL|nr:hypothetical protein IHE45_04G135400 [Dioscorea alata]